MSPRLDSVHDEQASVNDRWHDSLEKLSQASHRTSIFVKHHDLPPVWGRDSVSQSAGYKGRRVLGLCDEKSPYQASPLGAYGPPEIVDIGKQPFPAEYEMPSRYGRGMKPIYREEKPIPLAGNNNTWVPPVAQKKGVCGVSRRAFCCTFALICLLIIGGAVGGLVAGIMSSFKKSENASSNASAIAADSDSTLTSMSSMTSTMTLANGDVVLTTEVFTSLATIEASTTSSDSSTVQSSSSKMTSTSGSFLSTSSSFSSSPASSTYSSSKPTSTTASGPGLLSLNCPSINGSSASTSISSKVYAYTIFCNSDFRSGDLQTVNASSILDCYNACAQYTNANQKSVCAGVTFYANLTSPEVVGPGGNCGIHSDVSRMYSTGISNRVAAAVYDVGSAKRWFQGGLAGSWEVV